MLNKRDNILIIKQLKFRKTENVMDVRDKTVFSSHLFIHLLIIIRIVYTLHEDLTVFNLIS